MPENTLAVLFLTTATATNKDLNNSRATFTFNPPITFPSEGRIKVAISQFSFTNFFINISAILANNQFVIEDNTPATYTLTIPDGSYSVTDLSTTINNLGILAGLPDGLIQLNPNFSTGQVLFVISQANYRIFFPPSSPFILLGCILNQRIPAVGFTTGLYNELAPNVATFNSINNIYIHTSLSNNSIFSGRGGSDVIGSVSPVAPIGSTQIYEPTNLLYIDAHELLGIQLSNLNLYLTDQNNQPVSLQDDFSLTIVISHDSMNESLKRNYAV